MIIQPPFVVIGDEPPVSVKEHAEKTIKWAVDKLKQDYFSQDPKQILDIWLFKDAASYEKEYFHSVWRETRHAVRLLFERAQGANHEHFNRRRHAGT